jgi:hypothetical protein
LVGLSLGLIFSYQEVDQIPLRRSAGVILLAVRCPWRNDPPQSCKNAEEEQGSTGTGKKTLNYLSHIAFSVPGRLPTEPGSNTSAGSMCSPQVSQCRSITSAIDNARLQPGQHQKKSK